MENNHPNFDAVWLGIPNLYKEEIARFSPNKNRYSILECMSGNYSDQMNNKDINNVSKKKWKEIKEKSEETIKKLNKWRDE